MRISSQCSHFTSFARRCLTNSVERSRVRAYECLPAASGCRRCKACATPLRAAPRNREDSRKVCQRVKPKPVAEHLEYHLAATLAQQRKGDDTPGGNFWRADQDEQRRSRPSASTSWWTSTWWKESWRWTIEQVFEIVLPCSVFPLPKATMLLKTQK